MAGIEKALVFAILVMLVLITALAVTVDTREFWLITFAVVGLIGGLSYSAWRNKQ